MVTDTNKAECPSDYDEGRELGLDIVGDALAPEGDEGGEDRGLPNVVGYVNDHLGERLRMAAYVPPRTTPSRAHLRGLAAAVDDFADDVEPVICAPCQHGDHDKCRVTYGSAGSAKCQCCYPDPSPITTRTDVAATQRTNVACCGDAGDHDYVVLSKFGDHEVKQRADGSWETIPRVLEVCLRCGLVRTGPFAEMGCYHYHEHYLAGGSVTQASPPCRATASTTLPVADLTQTVEKYIPPHWHDAIAFAVEVAKVKARAERAERKVEDLAREVAVGLKRERELRANLALVATDAEGVWKWQGEGDDPASLSCPVVMDAETLRVFVADRVRADAAERGQADAVKRAGTWYRALRESDGLLWEIVELVKRRAGEETVAAVRRVVGERDALALRVTDLERDLTAFRANLNHALELLAAGDEGGAEAYLREDVKVRAPGPRHSIRGTYDLTCCNPGPCDHDDEVPRA